MTTDPYEIRLRERVRTAATTWIRPPDVPDAVISIRALDAALDLLCRYMEARGGDGGASR